MDAIVESAMPMLDSIPIRHPRSRSRPCFPSFARV